jgi:hypothetical protein
MLYRALSDLPAGRDCTRRQAERARTVVFPGGRVVKMSVTGDEQEIQIEDSMKDFGKLKRKFREDVPL